MEVRCLNCGKFYSVDDNTYKPTWKNYCSLDCQIHWLENNFSDCDGIFNPKRRDNGNKGKKRKSHKTKTSRD